MGVKSPESDFDLNSSFVPINISDFLKDLYTINDASEKTTKVNNYVHELEDELRKIHAFKRELPFCMLLLNDAIERLKEEKMNCKDAKARPLKEEFMPMKGGNSNEDGGAKKSSDCSEKKSWMSSAQLWSTNVENFDIKIQDSVSDLKSRMKEEDGYGSATENPYDQICSKLKNSGGAFVPFKRQSDLIIEKEKNKFLAINDLSLSVPRVDLGSITMNLKRNTTKTSSGSSFSTDPKRKPRRCWSLDLHRRFVNALQQLGGPQVATPKQIREIMQVGDLTNDEVKSHLQLQKYRIHAQKIPASSAPPTNCSRLAGDQYGNISKPSISLSGSPEGPLHMDTTAKGTSMISVEGDEDEKSEGHNWKCRLPKPVVEDQAALTDARILQIHDTIHRRRMR